jgi:hypothetical protein
MGSYLLHPCSRAENPNYLHPCRQIGFPSLRSVKSDRLLELENYRLKKLVAERGPEIEVMKEVAAKKW